MATHNETGRKGEDLAVVWLKENGFTLLHRNWRYKKAEIDIIACKNQVVHLVEVKTRSNLKFGYPEERISKRKIQLMMKAGAHFLSINRNWKRIQYDALSIMLIPNQPPSYFLIEDLYWSGL